MIKRTVGENVWIVSRTFENGELGLVASRHVVLEESGTRSTVKLKYDKDGKDSIDVLEYCTHENVLEAYKAEEGYIIDELVVAFYEEDVHGFIKRLKLLEKLQNITDTTNLIQMLREAFENEV